MLINEVSKVTGLTKKAIEYCVQQGLVCPVVLENGYRDFDEGEVERLTQIRVLRMLGLSTNEIKKVLSDDSGDTLRTLTVKMELDVQREQAKKSILDKLSGGADYSDIGAELQAIEASKTITERLLEAFPGYYGRFICLHFASFLNHPIETDAQQLAYERAIDFLDNMPVLDLPEELQEYLMEGTKDLGTRQITEMIENVRESIDNPDDFLSHNKEMLEQYFAYRQSDEYRKSPAYRLMSVMKEFNNTSGYYDVFIPALRQLSPSYDEYRKQLEVANQKLLAKYPDVEKLNE
ncbi:MAG: MerR family transcriptional regulator [Firmicutes bacterium]|jgi:DNA-binding transcriptional MerR regulator|nr:MerR family transcriptional regulator [Candidatus Fermentithermobacillaceae bacterium]